ncbi:hypothetical protein MRX96_006694 [Rhipicephalus microplus]
MEVGSEQRRQQHFARQPIAFPQVEPEFSPGRRRQPRSGGKPVFRLAKKLIARRPGWEERHRRRIASPGRRRRKFVSWKAPQCEGLVSAALCIAASTASGKQPSQTSALAHRAPPEPQLPPPHFASGRSSSPSRRACQTAREIGNGFATSSPSALRIPMTE